MAVVSGTHLRLSLFPVVEPKITTLIKQGSGITNTAVSA